MRVVIALTRLTPGQRTRETAQQPAVAEGHVIECADPGFVGRLVRVECQDMGKRVLNQPGYLVEVDVLDVSRPLPWTSYVVESYRGSPVVRVPVVVLDRLRGEGPDEAVRKAICDAFYERKS